VQTETQKWHLCCAEQGTKLKTLLPVHAIAQAVNKAKQLSTTLKVA